LAAAGSHAFITDQAAQEQKKIDDANALENAALGRMKCKVEEDFAATLENQMKLVLNALETHSVKVIVLNKEENEELKEWENCLSPFIEDNNK